MKRVKTVVAVVTIFVLSLTSLFFGLSAYAEEEMGVEGPTAGQPVEDAALSDAEMTEGMRPQSTGSMDFDDYAPSDTDEVQYQTKELVASDASSGGIDACAEGTFDEELVAQSEAYSELVAQVSSDRISDLSGATHTTQKSSTVILKPLTAGLTAHWYHDFNITVPVKTKIWVCTSITGGRSTGHMLFSCKDKNDNTLAGPFLQYTYDDDLLFSMTIPAGTSTINAYYNDDYKYSTSTASLEVGYSIGQSYSIADARINTFGDQVYTGKALTPKPKVEMQSTTRVDASSYSTKWITLTEGVDYRLSYSNNVNAGTATVNIIGIGQYEGSAQRSFTIHRFKDVPASHWAHDVITRAAELGLINGFSNGNFGPDAKVTRGQIAAILWNMAGKPAAGKGARSFPDVQGGAFYYDAVRWASSVGVVSGYGNGRFGPNDLVTREQLAVMLANYSSKVARRQASGSASDYASMSDASRVSSWARPAVGWCFRNKILSGKGGGRVDPQGNATRAEAAKMVVYLHDML